MNNYSGRVAFENYSIWLAFYKVSLVQFVRHTVRGNAKISMKDETNKFIYMKVIIPVKLE